MVTFEWEDINFRLHGVNYILRLYERLVRKNLDKNMSDFKQGDSNSSDKTK